MNILRGSDHAHVCRGKIFKFLLCPDIRDIRLQTNVKSTEESIPDVIEALERIYFELATTPMLTVGKIFRIQIYTILGFRPT